MDAKVSEDKHQVTSRHVVTSPKNCMVSTWHVKEIRSPISDANSQAHAIGHIFSLYPKHDMLSSIRSHLEHQLLQIESTSKRGKNRWKWSNSDKRTTEKTCLMSIKECVTQLCLPSSESPSWHFNGTWNRFCMSKKLSMMRCWYSFPHLQLW